MFRNRNKSKMRTKDRNYKKEMKIVFDESETDHVSFNALFSIRDLKDWFLLMIGRYEVS